MPPAALKVAKKLTWLHNPDAGPFHGYYYDELMNHPLTITNPRGIYFDHISHHILMFVMALSRGLPWYMDAQRRRVWGKDARKSPYIYLAEATALINGVGGIGHETASLRRELGLEVIGLEPRPESEAAKLVEGKESTEEEAPTMILSEDMSRAYQLRRRLGKVPTGRRSGAAILGQPEFEVFAHP